MTYFKYSIIFSALCFVLLTGAGITGCVHASSLWKTDQNDVFAERSALRIGQIVTILIQEKATASQTSSTQTKGESDILAGPGMGLMKWLGASGASSDTEFNGDGSTSRTGTLTASITATIVKKLANGNLQIQGTRKVRVNRETQEIEISGTVRPEDISPDNTIMSSYIANAEIKFKGRGAFSHVERPGLFQKLMHFLF
jgi:flagellar L-ring protein precursor FlgH